MRRLGMTLYFWCTVSAASVTILLALTRDLVPAMVAMMVTGVFYTIYVVKS